MSKGTIVTVQTTGGSRATVKQPQKQSASRVQTAADPIVHVNDIQEFSTSGATTNHTLVYNATLGKYENKNVNTVPFSLSDTTIYGGTF